MAKDDKQTKPYAKDTYDKVIEKVEKAGELQTAVNDLDLKSLGSNATNLKDTASDLNRTMRAKTSVNAGKFGASSIIGKASKNLFEFPVFISTSVSLDYATAVNALLEQIYASYLQMAISMDPVVSAEDVMKNRVFQHYKTDTTKFLEYTDMSYSHDACHNVITDDNGNVCEFTMVTVPDKIANLIVESANYEPLSEFDHFFQEAPGDNVEDHMNRYPLPRLTPDGTMIADPITFDGYGTLSELRDRLIRVAPHDFGTGNSEPAFQGYLNWMHTNHVPAAPSLATVNNADRSSGPNTSTSIPGAINNGLNSAVRTVGTVGHAANDLSNGIYGFATLKDRIQNQKMQNEKLRDEIDQAPLKKSEIKAKIAPGAPQYVDDNKCQKLNTMKPLLMTVAVNMLNKDDTLQPINYIVGVKTHLRVVPSDVLPEVALYPLKEMDKVSRKVKWRAGELKFLKDIVFRISEKKQTAADSRDPKRKWYRRLYELAHMKGDAPSAAVVQGKSLFASFIRDKQGKSKMMHGMIPNASIIMSKDDVDNIKAKTKIDLLKGSTAKKFCGELFLMSLIIIDADAESVKIMLPDINNDFDVHSIASINKQLATLDTAGTKTRDIFKMLG